MRETVTLHTINPQSNRIARVVQCLQQGGLIAYPTDSGYALGCTMGNTVAIKCISTLRHIPDEHQFTLICRNLSEISRYAYVDNNTYRLLKRLTPGAYTFILKASKEVSKHMQAKKKTIGIRIPDHAIVLALTAKLDAPLISTSLILPGQEEPIVYPEQVMEQIGHHVDIIIDGGACRLAPTTIVDVSSGYPMVLREGAGDISAIGSVS